MQICLILKDVFLSYHLISGWYTFDVTDAVLRWLTVNRLTKKSSKISNQLILEKGRMAVVKKSVNNTKLSSVKKDISLLPEGVFEKASLYVYSEDANHKNSREKRAASNTNRRGHNSRGRQRMQRRKGGLRMSCRRHKQYVDFMEVKYETII